MQHPVTLHASDEQLPSTETEFTAIANSRVEFARSGNDRLVTHTTLRAVDGTPAATVHLELPRSIHREVARTGWLIVAQVAGTALLFGVIFSVLLGRFVVARIEQLHDAVQRVGRENDLRLRVPVHGNDEIASLGTALNSMLDALARGRAERDEAHGQREKIQEHLLQAQKMEAIGEFAGGIAHDFNNCLTAITGWLSLVRHDLPKDSEHREHLGLALASAHHASAVVNQLLVYSRQGKTTLTPLSLRELLGSSLQLLRSGLPRTTELQLTTTGDDDVVLGDNTQIQQVVMNLVKNAADAMDKRGRVTLALDEISLPDVPGPARTSCRRDGMRASPCETPAPAYRRSCTSAYSNRFSPPRAPAAETALVSRWYAASCSATTAPSVSRVRRARARHSRLPSTASHGGNSRA